MRWLRFWMLDGDLPKWAFWVGWVVVIGLLLAVVVVAG